MTRTNNFQQYDVLVAAGICVFEQNFLQILTQCVHSKSDYAHFSLQ